MDSTGKSCEKSTDVVPRLKLAVPNTPLEPKGLSAPEVAVELWASSSRVSLSLAFQFRLMPVERFRFLVANSAPPMAMSLVAGLMVSEYSVGAAAGPSVQLLVDGPKLNQAERSLRRVRSLFSE